jgi:hypothetical protein
MPISEVITTVARSAQWLMHLSDEDLGKAMPSPYKSRRPFAALPEMECT